ncbi:MAG: YfhO family protein, partial [Ignavibacteriaceae bacterium]
DELITADVDASGNNFLFLGNTYYAGKADYKIFKISTGWSAYIDGNKVDIYKADHGFMGIVVPKGRHNIVFEFAPPSFYISKYVSLILSSITVAGLFLVIFTQYRKKKEPIAQKE